MKWIILLASGKGQRVLHLENVNVVQLLQTEKKKKSKRKLFQNKQYIYLPFILPSRQEKHCEIP